MTGKQIDWAEVRRRLAESERALERSLAPDAASMAAVLRRRAHRYAARTAPDHQATGLRVIVFALAGERFALPLAEVAEVLPLSACTPVPGLGAPLLGVVNRRGQIRPVVDLAALLGLPTAAQADGQAVFLRGRGGEFGLRADQVEAVRAVAATAFRRPSDEHASLLTHFVRGVAPDGLALLDVDAVRAAVATALGGER